MNYENLEQSGWLNALEMSSRKVKELMVLDDRKMIVMTLTSPPGNYIHTHDSLWMAYPDAQCA